jgi:hypothetical protein
MNIDTDHIRDAKKMIKPLIYSPPITTIENVDLDFPWLGKIWKVKKVPYKK